jgi:hypothetical protein
MRNSRRVKVVPARIGSPDFQSLVMATVRGLLNTSGVVRIMVVARSSLILKGKGIGSMA